MILCPNLSPRQGKISIADLGFRPSDSEILLFLQKGSKQNLSYRVVKLFTDEVELIPFQRVLLPNAWKEHFLKLYRPIVLDQKASENLLSCSANILPPLSIRVNREGETLSVYFQDLVTPASFVFHFKMERLQAVDKEIQTFRETQDRQLLEPTNSTAQFQKKAKSLLDWVFPQLKDFNLKGRRLSVFSDLDWDFPWEWLPGIGAVFFHFSGLPRLKSSDSAKIAILHDKSLPYADQETVRVRENTVFPFKVLDWDFFMENTTSLDDCSVVHVGTHGTYKDKVSALMFQKQMVQNLPISGEVRLTVLNACSSARFYRGIVQNILDLTGGAVVGCPTVLPEKIALGLTEFYQFLDPEAPEQSFEMFQKIYPEIAVYYRYFKLISDFI